MKTFLIVIVSLLTTVFPLTSEGQVPRMLSYQGVLTDTAGNPKLDATYSFTFRIYQTSSGGSALWSEIKPLTTRRGLFNTLLGDATAFPSSLVFDRQYWLSVQVSPEPELSPRVPLASVGYSFRSIKADTAAYALGSGGGPYLPLAGGAMAGAITNTGNPPITMGKGNFGTGNINSGTQAFVAGSNNAARGAYSTVAGGGGTTAVDSNLALGDWSTIGGGANNKTSGAAATVGGGSSNTASDGLATVGGGASNAASGFVATVGGGGSNTASNLYATVGGGSQNASSNEYATVGGGGSNTASGPVATVGGGGTNTASSNFATVSGGGSNTASGASATVSGGFSNTAGNDGATVAGGVLNSARGQFSFVGGGGGFSAIDSNSALGAYSAISGGQRNTASGQHATVSGGNINTSSALEATVAGGIGNTASGIAATVGGGNGNTASGYRGTASGGESNTASGGWATIPGGFYNSATADYSFAAGNHAYANHAGAIVLSADDNSSIFVPDPVGSSGNNQMVLRADGGFYLTNTGGAASIPAGRFLNTSTDAHLTTGGAWTNASDRNVKENFQPVNGEELLRKIALLPISRWNYKKESPGVKHIGPMAQDFYAAFGLGGDDKTISTIDPAGIALAAIQQLYKENRELVARVVELEALVKSLDSEKNQGIGEVR